MHLPDNPPTAFDAALQTGLEQQHRTEGLGAALKALHQHQVDSGFIRDHLLEVRRFEFNAGNDPEAYFSVQFNPARARRFAGKGRSEPPAWATPVHNGCFLCAENVAWQQNGIEKGFQLQLAQRPFTAWMNPFPLASGHAILATRDHMTQHWDASQQPLGRLVDELVALARQTPGWISFYNGVGAGASIEGHLHFHAMPRTPGLRPLPIEIAAMRANRDAPREGFPAIVSGHYPIDFVHWRGLPNDVQSKAGAWVSEWQKQKADDPDATANLMACHDFNEELIDLYFVPRVRSRSRAEGLSGVIGSFEAMGEIICSTEQEWDDLESGRVDYQRIHDILATVSVKL